MKSALIVVDLQFDFMPGGALPVPKGDDIVKPIGQIRRLFDTVIFTQDWHTADHCSFKQNGGIWPVHCLQYSPAASLPHRIMRPDDIVVTKGMDKNVDSYSGFWDNEKKNQTDLQEILRIKEIDDVYICGLATEYCVKYTALDAIAIGYQTNVIIDACRGITNKDVEYAYSEMTAKHVRLSSIGSMSSWSMYTL